MSFSAKDLGLNLIPCYPRDKKPAINWKLYQDIKYIEPIRPEMNRAVICGKTSGNLVVIDIDSPEIINTIFTDFEALKEKTLVVQTGSGGYHIYVRPKTGIQRTVRLDNPQGQHIDIQSDGTYVIAPGSIHPNGNPYKIISSVLTIMEMDIQGFVTNLSNYGFVIPEGGQLPPISDIVKGVPLGNRDNATYKYTAHLKSVLEFDKDTAWIEIQRWAEQIGHNCKKEKLKSTFESAWKRVPYPLEKQEPISILEAIKKVEYSNLKKISEVGSKDEGKEVSFDAFIAAIAEYRTVTTRMLVICPECKIEDEILGEGYINPRIKKCNDCKIKMQEKEILETISMREVLLQEFPEEANERTAAKFNGRAIGENAFKIIIGQKVRVTGKFQSFTELGKKDNEVAILIKTIETTDTPDDVDPTPEEIEIIKKDFDELIKSGKDPIKELLVPNFAPDLFGLELPKEVLLLTIAAAYKVNGMRGDINTLIIGDPSKGKSQLGLFTSLVAPKCGFANASTSSPAGLVYGMVKLSNGTMAAQAGLLVLKDGGFGVLDELDKTNEILHNAILQVMEEQRVPFNKGGVNLVAKAETAVIGLCNPIDGKWNTASTPMENINLPQPLVSRFDWIVGIIKTNQVMRGMIADSIFSKFKNSTMRYMDIPSMKHYLNYVRKLQPELTEDTFKKLREFYMKTVQLMDDEGLPFEERQLEGLVRGTIARAKLLMKDKTDIGDANAIIELFKKSLVSLCLKIEGDTIQSVFEDKKTGLDRAFRKILHEMEDDAGHVDQTGLYKKLIEKYPQFFETVFDCEKIFKRYVEASKLILHEPGIYKIRL